MSASNEVISNYVEQRITRLEVSQENIVQSLARIEKTMSDGFSSINNKFNQVDERFIRLENKFDGLESRMHSNFKFLISAILGQSAIMITLFSGIMYYLVKSA
jgi:phage-related protein